MAKWTEVLDRSLPAFITADPVKLAIASSEQIDRILSNLILESE
jgi:hypothetical protein